MPGTIITLGLGSFGNPSFVITLGLGNYGSSPTSGPPLGSLSLLGAGR